MKLKQQRGITIVNLLVAAIVIVFSVLLSVRLVPPYLNNRAVKDAMNELAANPDIRNFTKAKMRDMIVRKFQVNYINTISPDALVLTKKGDNAYLKMKYEERVHLIGNIDAVVMFDEEVRIGGNTQS